MTHPDPYQPDRSYVECPACGYREAEADTARVCPECGGEVRNLAVARE